MGYYIGTANSPRYSRSRCDMSSRFASTIGLIGLALALLAARPAPGQEVTVRDVAGLRRAVAAARPGTRILLAPGEYPGGLNFSGISGAAGQPVVIGAQDPKDPPR